MLMKMYLYVLSSISGGDFLAVEILWKNLLSLCDSMQLLGQRQSAFLTLEARAEAVSSAKE